MEHNRGNYLDGGHTKCHWKWCVNVASFALTYEANTAQPSRSPALGIKTLMSKYTVIATHCEVQLPETQYRAEAHVTVHLHNDAKVRMLN